MESFLDWASKISWDVALMAALIAIVQAYWHEFGHFIMAIIFRLPACKIVATSKRLGVIRYPMIAVLIPNHIFAASSRLRRLIIISGGTIMDLVMVACSFLLLSKMDPSPFFFALALATLLRIPTILLNCIPSRALENDGWQFVHECARK